MKRFSLCLCVALLLTMAMPASADIISLVGDKDGFGLAGAPAVPADGTLWRDGLGGVFFTDYRGAGDLANAPFTDIWAANDGFSYSHSYSLGGQTAISATLDIQIAGIHDINDGTTYNFFVDGTIVGTIPFNSNANAFQEVKLYSFNIPLALINGLDTINLSGTGGDGYAINFSELRIETSAVPEPTTMLLIGLGLMGLAGIRRKIE
jgi:hypothetical protein